MCNLIGHAVQQALTRRGFIAASAVGASLIAPMTCSAGARSAGRRKPSLDWSLASPPPTSIICLNAIFAAATYRDHRNHCHFAESALPFHRSLEAHESPQRIFTIARPA